MACDRTGSLLDAYFDNELDPMGAAEFERHLTVCPDCTSTLEGLKSLRASFGRAQLYQKSPESLRKRVLGEFAISKSSVKSAHAPVRWLALAAAILLLATAGWKLLSISRERDRQSILATEIVDAHLRSLEPGHLTDVLSSDQHTVKPWFEGKLDFAPPVKDFAEQGFPLQGGRLDVVQGRTVAALIYGRHKHIVSVFLWPTNEKEAEPRSGSQNGYQWIAWRKGGMEFGAVSDTSPADLEQLQRLFSEQSAR